MAETREQESTRERLLQNVRKVLEAVKRFEGRIGDPKAWTAIHERAEELRQILTAFPDVTRRAWFCRGRKPPAAAVR
jgi:hypothetical protein